MANFLFNLINNIIIGVCIYLKLNIIIINHFILVCDIIQIILSNNNNNEHMDYHLKSGVWNYKKLIKLNDKLLLYF